MSQEDVKFGRPRKELDWQSFEQLCRLQCTQQEIAAFYSMTIVTLNTRIRELTGGTFLQLYDELSCGGRISLRRAQWKAAIGEKKLKPSIQMQIWLGKQVLNQSDKIQSDTTISAGKVNINFKGDKKPEDIF